MFPHLFKTPPPQPPYKIFEMVDGTYTVKERYRLSGGGIIVDRYRYAGNFDTQAEAENFIASRTIKREVEYKHGGE